MDCLNIGIIGYGVVGQGVVKALKQILLSKPLLIAASIKRLHQV
jgi:homoserine dehydrogenase